MKITFHNEDNYKQVYNNILENFFREPFDLFGQRMMIYTISGSEGPDGGFVEMEIVEVD